MILNHIEEQGHEPQGYEPEIHNDDLLFFVGIQQLVNLLGSTFTRLTLVSLHVVFGDSTFSPGTD